jgi:hypothetical protein
MTLEPSHPQYRPVWHMLQEVAERFKRPLFVGETGIEDHARPAWLRYMGHEARTAIRQGVPVHGLCLYPIVNHPGWDDDRHCYNGLWDYADESGARDIYVPLASELENQRQLWARPQFPAGESAEADAQLLDVASHWMEIRSGREDILHKQP